MGHDVVKFSPHLRLERYQTGLSWRAARRLYGGVLPRHRREHAQAFNKCARKAGAELVIILKGLLLSAEDVSALKKTSRWVVNINHDDFFSTNRNNWSRDQRGAIPVYDYIFTTREVNVEEVKPMNSNVEFFPFAYFPRIHHPAGRSKAAGAADVLFVGTWERARARMLERLVGNVSANYAIYGSQWGSVGRKSPLRPFLQQRELVGEDMAAAISRAKISLGFLRKENRDEYTQRTFEIPACGGVLLAERTPRHMKWFKEGEEAEFFDAGDFDELAAKVRHLLTNDTHREEIRQKGRSKVLGAGHTYRDRLKRLLYLYQSNHR